MGVSVESVTSWEAGRRPITTRTTKHLKELVAGLAIEKVYQTTSNKEKRAEIEQAAFVYAGIPPPEPWWNKLPLAEWRSRNAGRIRQDLDQLRAMTEADSDPNLRALIATAEELLSRIRKARTHEEIRRIQIDHDGVRVMSVALIAWRQRLAKA